MRLNLKLLVVFLVLGLNLKLSANEISNDTLPTDPNVTHGTAEISQGANQLTIDQQTDKLITNWSSFNIGSDAKVQFNQPSSNSSALNHVNSADPSYIYGSLEANGKVILINPNGVIFANGSRVDVGAIVASSLKLSDENFLKDNFVFEKDGIAGIVENHGTIKAFEGGAVALISSIVKNNGTIETPNGSTALLAGEKVTLNLNYNQLISYTIDSGTLNGLVENNNAIVANNGQVILSARGLDAVRKSVVNTDGIIEAKGINTEGGKIFLEGDEITVKSNSTLNATGDNGGGQILVGGSWQNSDPTIYQAKTTTIEEGATLNASANNTGNGGEIVVWSDITNDQSITKVQGKLTAEGGKNSGNGGQIETSGYKLDVEVIEVSTLANDGSAGEWLLDPGEIIIRDGGSASLPGESGSSGNTTISPSTILTGLASSNVNIYTGINGSTEYDIDVENSIAYTGDNERTLTFKATGSIDAKNGLDVAITSSNAPLNLIYWADADGDGDGHAQIGKGNTTTNGGDLWIGGGDGSTTWNGHTVGDDYASTVGNRLYGVFFREGAIVNTGSGDIKISGRADGTHNYEVGVSIAERGSSIATSITSTGNIEINGSDTNSTGTIDTPIYLSSVASINGNGGSTKNITINVDSVDSDTAQFLGNITGTANVIKNGSGILTLSGTNTYTGLTTVSAGTLTLDQASSTTGTVIKDTSAVTVNGGILNLADNTETIGALTLTAGSITGNSKILTGSSYTINPGEGVSVSIAPILAGSVNLTKSAQGTLTLSGTNTYTGNTTINRGIISVSSDRNLGAVPAEATASHIILNGGTISTTTTFELASTRGIELGSSHGTITVADSTTLTYDGIIADASGETNNFTKDGNGILDLGGTNTYTGTTTISAGTLKVTGTLAQTAVDVDTGATYDVDLTDTVLSIEGAGTIDLTNAALTAGDGNDLTFSGVFNGANDFTKVGSSTLTLSGDNATASYTGRVIIDDGVVSVAADSNLGDPDTLDADRLILKGGTLSASSNFTLDTNRGITLSTGGGTINVVSGRTLTYGGVIDGTSTFYKSCAGTLILSGTNTNTGSTSITAGTLRVTGALDDTAVSVSSGATYDVDATDAVANISGEGTVDIASGVTLTVGSNNLSTTLSGVISGDGNLIKVGTGRITLSGANDYTGSTTVSAGYLRAQHNTALGTTAGNTNVANGATLELIGGITIGSGEDLTIIGDGMSDGNYLGALRNVSGTNTYQGSITLSTSTSRIVSSDGTLNVSGNIINGSIDLIITGSGDTSISGVIGSGSGALSKRGSGILTLSGTNTYTGITTISAGTLSISADAGLGSISSFDADRLTFNGGTLLITETITLNTNRGITLSTDGGTIHVANTKTVTYDGVITGSTTFTKDGNGILDLGGTNTYTGATTISDGELNVTGSLDATALTVSSGATYDSDTTDTIGSIAGAGNIEIATGTTLTVGGDNTDTTFSGVISQDGNLTKEGSGTLTLTGTNTNTGDLTVDAGGLVLDQAGTDTGTVLHNSSNLILNAGSVTVSDTSETVDLFTYNGGSVTGQIISISGYTYYVADGLTTTIASILYGDVPLVKSGPGSLVLTATNTYTGNTTINAGTLKIDGTGSLESGNYDALIINNGTFIHSSTTDQTLAGVISGSGTVVKEENSTLTLTATNTYTGLTTVSAGTLTLDQASSTTGTVIKDTNAVTVNGGTLNLADNTETIGALTLTSGSIAGNSKTLTGSGYTINPGDGVSVSIQPILAGSGINLTKSEDGTATLSGANTYTGTTTINDGTLTVTGTLSDSTDVSNSGIYDVDTTDTINSLSGTGAVEIASGVTLTTGDTEDYTISGIISGDGSLTKVGSGTLTLSNVNNSYTGATTVNVGTLKVTTNNALGTNAAGTTVASGATLDFANINYATTEAITVNGGTIATSSGTSIVAGVITLGAHSIFDIDGTQLTVSGNITDGDGTYNITKTGNGILVLSNTTNSYDGTTTISTGTLTVIGRLDSGTYSANIINNSALIYNSISTQEFVGAVSGTGTLTKNGSSTLTLSGTNTYSGDTTINAGTIKLTGSVNALTDLSIASGATLDLQATQTFATLDLDGTISNSAGSSELTITGASDLGGSITTSGSQTYSSAVTLSVDVTLTTTDSNITFSSTIDGDGTARDLTIDMDNGVGADGTVQFANTVVQIIV